MRGSSTCGCNTRWCISRLHSFSRNKSTLTQQNATDAVANLTTCLHVAADLAKPFTLTGTACLVLELVAGGQIRQEDFRQPSATAANRE